MDIQQMRALEQTIDTTWGRASTNDTNATMSIKANLHDNDGLRVLYTTIVNLGSLHEWEMVKGCQEDEAAKIIDQYAKMVKKNYKEATGETLKLKSVANNDSIELISMSAYSPRRTAYYRMIVDFEVTA